MSRPRRKCRMVLIVLFSLAACSKEPRSAGYFESHPKEAARVLSACADGVQRGRECDTAMASKIARESRARETLFRRGFR